MLVQSSSSQDDLNRKVNMYHKGYMIPRNQRNFGVFGLARRFSTIIFTVLGYRCVQMNKGSKFQKELWRCVGDGVIGNPFIGDSIPHL